MKPTTSRRIGFALASISLATVLTACGGGDDNAPEPAAPPTVATNTPPDTASASVGGFIAFLKVLTATMPETTDPLDVANFVAPTDDVGPYDATI